MTVPALLSLPAYHLTQRTKLIELTGEYVLTDPSGQVVGHVVERAVGAAQKTLRAVLGFALPINRALDVVDTAGQVAFTVTVAWRDGVRVITPDGRLEGVLMARAWSFLPVPAKHPILDGNGQRIGSLRTHGIRRRRFSLELDGVVLARARQPWAGLLREWYTQADRFEYSRVEASPAGAHALAFALPLLAELAFKGLGSPSPILGGFDLLS